MSYLGLVKNLSHTNTSKMTTKKSRTIFSTKMSLSRSRTSTIHTKHHCILIKGRTMRFRKFQRKRSLPRKKSTVVRRRRASGFSTQKMKMQKLYRWMTSGDKVKKKRNSALARLIRLRFLKLQSSKLQLKMIGSEMNQPSLARVRKILAKKRRICQEIMATTQLRKNLVKLNLDQQITLQRTIMKQDQNTWAYFPKIFTEKETIPLEQNMKPTLRRLTQKCLNYNRLWRISKTPTILGLS